MTFYVFLSCCTRFLEHWIRYDTRRYYNVRCDRSQLNLPHGTRLKQWKREELKSKKTDMLRSIGRQSGESVESVPEN